MIRREEKRIEENMMIDKKGEEEKKREEKVMIDKKGEEEKRREGDDRQE